MCEDSILDLLYEGKYFRIFIMKILNFKLIKENECMYILAYKKIDCNAATILYRKLSKYLDLEKKLVLPIGERFCTHNLPWESYDT